MAIPDNFDTVFTAEMQTAYQSSDFLIDMMLDFIHEHWTEWEQQEAAGWGRGAWDQLLQYIWVTYSGGNLAEDVATRIRTALDS